MDTRVSFKLNNINKTVDRICRNDSLGQFMAQTCARYMDKFVPMDTGMLAQTFTTKPFEVVYEKPYARKLFFGEGFNFSKEKHPLATARWDKACSSANGQAIASELIEFIKRM